MLHTTHKPLLIAHTLSPDLKQLDELEQEIFAISADAATRKPLSHSLLQFLIVELMDEWIFLHVLFEYKLDGLEIEYPVSLQR